MTVNTNYRFLNVVAVKVETKTSVLITKTCLYNFDPLKPQFYIVNWGLQGLHYFSYFCSKHRLWVLVRTASPRRF